MNNVESFVIDTYLLMAISRRNALDTQETKIDISIAVLLLNPYMDVTCPFVILTVIILRSKSVE